MSSKKSADPGKPADPAAVEATSPVPETPEAEPVAADAADLEQQLEACREEAEMNRDLYLRARADLENYRRRAQKEREDLAKFGNENLLRELLPVIDNLERALAHAQGDGGGLLEGVEMTLGQFRRVLEKFGVRGFTAVGEPFDPARHEAMGQLESGEHPPGTVVQEMQKGYLLNERLLRPAMVMIAAAPSEKQD